MDDDLVRGVQLLVLQLVALDALIHLDAVAPNLAAVFVSGVFPRITTALIALSILLSIAGVVAFVFELVPRRTLYLLGIAFMLTLILGWFVYHNLSTPVSHSHENVPIVQSTIDHLTLDPLEGASKATEALALVLLVILLRIDPRARSGESRTASADAEMQASDEA